MLMLMLMLMFVLMLLLMLFLIIILILMLMLMFVLMPQNEKCSLLPATGSCHKSQLQVRATSAEKRSAEQPEIRGLMEELDRGCCGAVWVGSRARTFSLEPARIGLRGIADEDGKVTKELSDIVDGGTRGVATQEDAHHLDCPLTSNQRAQGAAQGLSGSPVPS